MCLFAGWSCFQISWRAGWSEPEKPFAGFDASGHKLSNQTALHATRGIEEARLHAPNLQCSICPDDPSLFVRVRGRLRIVHVIGQAFDLSRVYLISR
jgi:hypothetical protein